MEYKHLAEEERYQIDDPRREGFKQNIARLLGRSPSTLSREPRRNQEERGWRSRQAQLKSTERLLVRGNNNARKASQAAWYYAENIWQKISEARSKLLAAQSVKVCRQSAIKQFINASWKTSNSGGDLYSHLCCKKKRKKHYGSARTTRGTILNRGIVADATINVKKHIYRSVGSKKEQKVVVLYNPFWRLLKVN